MDSTASALPALSEQADLIAQLIKYSDRLIVIQTDDPDARAEFTRQVAERLPADVHVFTHQATPDSTPHALVNELTGQLQLSPGIESPRQLVTAIHEALTGNTRALAMIEDLEQWQGTPAWDELLNLIKVAHDMSSRHLLFLLSGDTGLETRLRANAEIADMQGDIHAVTLSSSTATTTTADTSEGDAAELTSEATQPEPIRRRGHRNRRFNPTLLIIAGISVLVVTVGGFALLSRSGKENQTETQKIAINTSTTSPVKVDEKSPAKTMTPEQEQPTPAVAPAPSAPTPSPSASTPTEAEPAEPHSTVQPTPSQMQAAAEKAPAESATEASSEKPPAAAAATNEQPKIAPPPAKAPTPAIASVKKPQPAPEKSAAPHKPSPSAKAPARADNDWYTGKPRARAVVQLGAFTDLASARHFVASHSRSVGHDQPWHIFTQKPKGKLLYTVTIGDFASVERARHAVKSLPQGLRHLKPYPRSIGSIQDAIKH